MGNTSQDDPEIFVSLFCILICYSANNNTMSFFFFGWVVCVIWNLPLERLCNCGVAIKEASNIEVAKEKGQGL